MNGIPADKGSRRLKYYVLAVGLVWTAIVAFSLYWNDHQHRREVVEAARTVARTAYDKDIVYRQWNTQHGGVYAPVTEGTQPNPYLSHLPERDITTPSGVELTLINPAYMTRQAHQLERERYGVRGHITSLNPIRPQNAPDPWETEALQAFEWGEVEQSSIQPLESESYMRLMRPLTVEQGCLQCHADQGYQLGQIRGGLSVSVPMAPLWEAGREQIQIVWGGHIVLWLVGLGMIGWGGRELGRWMKAVRQGQALLADTLESLPHPFCVIDVRDYSLSLANSAAAAHAGLNADLSCYALTHQRDRPCAGDEHPCPLQLVQQSKAPVVVQHVHHDQQDNPRYVQVHAFPVFDEQGDVTQMIEYALDVTEQKRAEQALQHSEERYSLAQKAASIGSWDWHIPSGQLYWSEQIELLFGFEPGQFAGTYQAFLDLVHPDDRQAVVDAIDACIETDADYAIDHRIVRPDGTVRWVSESGDVVRDREGQPLRMLGVVQDITQRKRMEKELARSNAELEQFAYVVSHDLQEPLRMVASYLQLLERRYAGQLDDKADTFIDYAVDGAVRMQEMIKGLLQYSRVTTRGKAFEEADLERVWQDAQDNLMVLIQESGAVVSHDPLPLVLADETQMLQLFQNLLGNAIKFRGEEPPRVHLWAEQKAEEWVVAVQDNGIGIDPSQAERIFDIFQRLHTREEYEGTGIGLAVCKRIVERHGGRIWVASQPGEGAIFYFTLPLGPGGDLLSDRPL